jgi:hypothetical protein
MLLRQASTSDLPALMALVRNVVPLMRASGNLQWDDGYPSTTNAGRQPGSMTGSDGIPSATPTVPGLTTPGRLWECNRN